MANKAYSFIPDSLNRQPVQFHLCYKLRKSFTEFYNIKMNNESLGVLFFNSIENININATIK